jgi:hypothetical protein
MAAWEISSQAADYSGNGQEAGFQESEEDLVRGCISNWVTGYL